MSTVNTIKGPISSADLGRVLVHEHVFTSDLEILLNYGKEFDEEREVREAADKMNAIKASGIDTIIDLTVIGLGRYIPRIQKVAEQTDLNIVVSTGCYTLNEVPAPFRMIGPGMMFDQPDPMPGLFLGDIVDGIADTGVFAGELKCAIDKAGLTSGVERVMRAVGKVNVASGTPISVHTDSHSRSGLVAQRVLAEEGVDLRDVIIGHSGDTTDLDYLMELADAGSILGMDRFGMSIILSDEQRMATIIEMIRRGYIEHLTLSHDCYCWTNLHPGGGPAVPGHSHLVVSEKVIPALIEAGITRGQIEVMLVENPRRHFEGAAERFAARQAATAPAAN
jgi:phosphotriesterase-related protein